MAVPRVTEAIAVGGQKSHDRAKSIFGWHRVRMAFTAHFTFFRNEQAQVFHRFCQLPLGISKRT